MVSNTSASVIDVDSFTMGPTEPRESAIGVLIDQRIEILKEALMGQYRHQEQLLKEMRAAQEKALCELEETKSELTEYKKALSDANRERHDLEEGFKQERQALNDEILQLKAIVIRTEQAECQQDLTDTPQHEILRRSI